MKFPSISVSCGHFAPGDQMANNCLAVASLALFNRTLNHFDVATGEEMVTGTLSSTGQANATHTEPYVPLPTSTGSSSASAQPNIHAWRKD